MPTRSRPSWRRFATSPPTWMERLAAFRPFLTGAVWRGTATRLNDIHIELYCDDSKAAELALIDGRVDYEVSRGESAARPRGRCAEPVRARTGSFAPGSDRAHRARLRRPARRAARRRPRPVAARRPGGAERAPGGSDESPRRGPRRPVGGRSGGRRRLRAVAPARRRRGQGGPLGIDLPDARGLDPGDEQPARQAAVAQLLGDLVSALRHRDAAARRLRRRPSRAGTCWPSPSTPPTRCAAS